MPAIADYFGAGDDRVNLTFSLYILTMALAQLVVGPLSDRFGRLLLLQAGSLVFLAAGAACALAPALGVLIAARVVQGAGACASNTVGRAVVRDVHHDVEAARALAAISLVMALAPGLGPTVGGFIGQSFGWRTIFAVLVVLGVVNLALVRVALHETLPEERRKPLRLGRIMRTYAELLRDGRYMGYALAIAFGMGGLGAYLAGAPFIFIRLLHTSEPMYGSFSIINVGCFAIGSAIASRVTGRWFTMPGMIVIGACLSTLSGCVLLALMLAGTLSIPAILGPMAGYFIGTGLLTPNAMAAAINRHPDHAGLASAMLGFLQFSGWTAASLAVGILGTQSAVPLAGTVAATATLTGVVFVLLHGWPAAFRAGR
jgi:DHA1 family bicyclomycin/chloramphenicol resistance-like MFS transporter